VAEKTKRTPKRKAAPRRHAQPVIKIDETEPTGPEEILVDEDPAVHPAGHRFAGTIGAVPATPNLSPGGSVTIKR
jgi:hypothetical protein